MMNYDGLLAQLTDDKLVLFDNGGGTTVEEGAILEEQAAVIQTVPQHAQRIQTNVRNEGPSTSIINKSLNNATAISSGSAAISIPATTTTNQNINNVNVTTTPQRKISTSSRFMNAFTQFYNNATNSAGSNVIEQQEDIDGVSANMAAVNRTPTKGMEAKLLSMWHNVKYGWSGKIKANFSKEQPVWLLGRCYHRRYTPPVSMENSTELEAIVPLGSSAVAAAAATEMDNYCIMTTTAQNAKNEPDYNINKTGNLYPQLNTVDEIVVPQELGMDAADNQVAESPWEEGIEGFRKDFYSRIWMTYRREFPLMNGSSYTSDCGWGCMLRSGQMLLAQGLICHFLGRNWRYEPETQMNSTFEDNMHRKIIRWFGDNSSKSSPFSIHALVHLGEELGKKPGDWYGPSSVSYLLKRALKNAAQENADFDNIAIYVARDCTIYMQDVEDLCCIPEPIQKPQVPWQTPRQPRTRTKSETKQNWKSLILLIPLRLGSEKLNTVYAHCLKLLLSTEYCIGIIGGRPKHSLYFVGFQEDRLIHLDPHYCQEMVDVNQENFPLHSFHCKSPRKLKTSKMDPSCSIGFYCQTRSDFDNFIKSVELYLYPMRCASGTIDRVISSGMQMPNSSTSSQSNEGNNVYQEMNYPLFTFSKGRCTQNEKDEMSDSLYKPVQKQMAQIDHNFQQSSNIMNTSNTFEDEDGETEEFVVL